VKTLDDLQSPLSPYGRGAGGEGGAREDFFAAEVGITNVHRLIAETGTVVLASKPDEPRSASLLPPVHIAIADRSQLLPDLFDLFDLFSPVANLSQSTPPSCLTLITGPSKTGDIELKLVTGVHGPGEIHVILCNGGQ
jgi:L-lactate dehydrogenase complex protein LldG